MAMETIKELSEDLRDATNGSPHAARIMSLRVELRQSILDAEAQSLRAERAEQLLAESLSLVEKMKTDADVLKSEEKVSREALERRIVDLETEKEQLTSRVKNRDEEVKGLKKSVHEELERALRIKNDLSRETQDALEKAEASEREKKEVKTQANEAERRAQSIDHSRRKEINILQAELESEKKRRLELEEAALQAAKIRLSESLSEGLDEQMLKLRTENTEMSKMRLRLEAEVDMLRKQTIAYEKRLDFLRSEAEANASLRSSVEKLTEESKRGREAIEMVDVLKEEKARLSDLIRKLSSNADLRDGVQMLRTLADGKMPEVKASMTNNHEAELRALQIERSKMVSELETIRSDAQLAKLSLARSDRRRLVMEKERSALRTIISAYEEDLAGESRGDDIMTKRLDASEDTLKKMEDVINALEKEIRDKDVRIGELMVRATEAESMVKPRELQADEEKSPMLETLRARLLEAISDKVASEKKVELVEARNKKLKENVAALESKLEVASARETEGEKERVKILHMKGNPSIPIDSGPADRKRPRVDNDSEVHNSAEAEEEISSLRNRIRELEATGDRATSEEMRKAIADADKRAQRTREVAKMKIEEFRLACYNLFGYKMQVSGAKYTLSSMYAEREEDVLCFGRNESGGMELLETKYCTMLQDEVEQYLRRWNSIPALLAHITSDNFQKTTVFAL